MRTQGFSKLLYTVAVLTLLFAQSFQARAVEFSLEEAASSLPDVVSDFRARGAASLPAEGMTQPLRPDEFAITGYASRLYASPKGEQFGVMIIKTRSDSGAYALLVNHVSSSQKAEKLEGMGTAAFNAANSIIFFKGPAFVRVYGLGDKPAGTESLVNFARAFADTLDKGENDIPSLVKHLPEWETAWQRRLSYSVSPAALKSATSDRPVLDAVSFEGGTEAVAAFYNQAQLVIVEFTTPQLATSNDARIQQRLRELRDAGQPVPTAYRRVGNYSVFVFDAPDEASAAKLIDSIKYEQVVQWLGDNPYALQRATRKYTETTAGVIVAVLKASGLSLLVCLGIGAVFGGIVFKRRRQQQATTEAFSDAGGMVRLNLDEMTPHYEPGKLLGPGEGR